MSGSPFPGSRPLASLIAEAGATETRDARAGETVLPYAFIGMIPACVWVRFPEPLVRGSVVFGGAGETFAAADDAARRNWQTWRRQVRSHPPKLPEDGREYQRRTRTRRRRRR